MRVLVSAIACHPRRGSEAHVGWNVVRALAQHHEVWLMGHENDREVLEEAQQCGLLPPSVTCRFHGKSGKRHPNGLVARLQNWMDFKNWNRDLWPRAKALHEEVAFEIAHHVTVVSWRVPSPLWRLGIPFVWGPLGGGERFPARCHGALSVAGSAFEVLRSAHGMISRHSPSVRECARHSAAVLAGNTETETVLKDLRGSQGGVHRLSAVFFNKEQIAALRPPSPAGIPRTASRMWTEIRDATPDTGRFLKIFAGGEIEGRKGLSIALNALRIARDQGVSFRFIVGGRGEDAIRLRQMAKRLGLARDVHIGETLEQREYHDAIRSADLYLLPSLRDSAGITLMESMLAGCAPIVADCGGPHDIVTTECGIKIPVATPEQMACDIAGHLLNIWRNIHTASAMGAAASAHIMSQYSEEAYLERIDAIYSEAVARFNSPKP